MHFVRRVPRPGPGSALLPALALILAIAGTATPARADRFVAVGGDDLLNDCTSSLSPCATVPYAATLATAGEVINVGAPSRW